MRIGTVMLMVVGMMALATVAKATEVKSTDTTIKEQFKTEGTKEQFKTEGKVSQVTLYRNQALITRLVDVGEVKVGTAEIVIENLPEQIVPDSLFAEGSEDLEIRGVQFRTRAVGESPREEVRKIEAEIETVNQELAMNQKMQQLANKQSEYLDKLEGFVAPTATTEISKGVLDAEALERLTKFSFEQRTKIATDQLELAKAQQQLQRKLNLLQAQLSELTSGATRRLREAVVYVQKNGAEGGSLRLSYLVANCGWSPSYTIRGEEDSETVSVEYSGLIRQMSGEPWADVELTLSTATPGLSAAGPGLAPFRMTLVAGGQAEAEQIDVNKLQQYKMDQSQAILENRNAVDLAGNFQSSWTINDAVNKLQCAEINGEESVVTAVVSDFSTESQQPSLSYQLKNRVSLSSRNNQQIVRILQTDLPSEFYHIATPVLTSYVYREAEVGNQSAVDLLAGPITVYLNSRFVGRGEIPTVARGQSFVVGFGADPQLRAHRELTDKSDEIKGGNRELTLKYRLLVENYKSEPVTIRVIDRLPSVDNSDQVQINLKTVSDELSEDTLYRRDQYQKGFLRWEIKAEANAVGEHAREIAYSYSVEHDRNYYLNNPVGTAQMREEFEQLQRGRFKR
jgi:uncharacterized protein (TIGR02231 family)